MDMECLEHGIVKYGTPLYVFNIDEMRKTVSLFRKKLGGKAGLYCYESQSFFDKADGGDNRPD